MNTSKSVDKFIASAASEVRPVLEEVRSAIRKAAPNAKEGIGHHIPTFYQDGALVYFYVTEQHLNLYPSAREEALRPALLKYKGPSGILQFPLTEPIPLVLISKVVKARIKENQARMAAKSKPAPKA